MADKKKKKLWEVPRLAKDIKRAAHMGATALGVGGAALYDPVSMATEYATGVKTPRLMGQNIGEFRKAWGMGARKKKKVPAPGVPVSTQGATTPTPGATIGGRARETLGAPVTPLYTNVPERMAEPGALPVRPMPRNDRFSNVGSFTFKKPETQAFKTLSREEASRKGAMVGQTGEQYSLMRESEHTKRLRAKREQMGGIAAERAGRTPGKYQTDVIEGPDFSQRLAVTGPKGRTTWARPPEVTPGGLETGPLNILPVKDFTAMPDAKKKAYMERLEKENSKAFLDLRKALKLDVRK
jgi:hypothetical protein